MITFVKFNEQDPLKKQAEIAAYCLDFDVAEKQYMDMDRKDLALDLRIRLGDWFRVVQLIKTGGSGDDALLEKAYNNIGDYYAERQRWQQAANYYGQARNYEKLVDVYYILEDFENIEKIAVNLSENSPQLRVSFQCSSYFIFISSFSLLPRNSLLLVLPSQLLTPL